MSEAAQIAVIGGGPAGLRAAEACAAGGAEVDLFEAKRSAGRKLLVAGYGGLNLTHGEDLDTFVTRYSGPDLPVEHFAQIIRSFSPTDLRQWAAQLGIESFEQRTGRVYPKEMKAAPLLRRWIERLRRQGVTFHVNKSLTAITSSDKVRLSFEDGETRNFDAVILALGGASWSRTGSDGLWTGMLESHGVRITPFEPANCGWEVDWGEDLAAKLEGQPLKNLAASAGPIAVQGELMPTRYGLEGGAIYQLGPVLRAMPEPVIEIDFKPEVPLPNLLRKMESVKRDFLAQASTRLNLSEPASLLLEHFGGSPDSTPAVCEAVKSLKIPLIGPRPIDEAISSAGGVAWTEIDDFLQLRRLPGVFVCGEMIDWEAPTGGYLIQGCFATATHAARGALRTTSSA